MNATPPAIRERIAPRRASGTSRLPRRRARRARGSGGAPHSLTLGLDEFAWESINEAAEEFEISREDFARFAILSYLAALDCGCIPRRRAPAWIDSLLQTRA